ncbi:MAG: O-antigen ligase family protein [Pseudomonadota bacterium]
MNERTYTALKSIFSFETFFVLFLFSPQFKSAYPFSLAPNLSLLLAIILLAWFVILYRKCPEINVLTLETSAFLVFSGWCLVSSFWVDRTTYSISKALCFGVYTVPAFFMAYCIIGTNQHRLKRFLYAIGILSFWVHLASYKDLILSHWHRVDVLGANYLVTGQTLGFGFICLCLLSFFLLKECEKQGNEGQECEKQGSEEGAIAEKKALRQRFVFWLLMLVCGSTATIQLHLGGRGPVLGLLLTLMYFYIYGARHGNARLCGKHFFTVSLTCFLSYFFVSWLFDTQTCSFVSRASRIIFPQEIAPNTFAMDESLGLRLEYYESALALFLKHPLLGVGFGGWAHLHDTLYHYVPEPHDLRDVFWRHPHNIGLEVLVETGLVGSLLGIWCGALVFRKIVFKRLIHSFLDAAPILLLIFSFFNALKSGDLNDNILFFVMAGIIAAKKK